MIVKSGWRDRLRAYRWERQRRRQRGEAQPIMSTATTTTGATPKAEAAQPVHLFRGGPFDGQCYNGDIGVRLGARPGTLVVMVPAPYCLASAFAWKLAIIRWDSNPSPSERGRWAVYRNGESGEWHYVPHE